MSAFNSQGKVSATLPQQGTALWNKMPKINAELFALTYGAMVMQLIKDHEDVDAVNKQLEKMGYNIGIRIVDEFLAKGNITKCNNFRETAEMIGKVAFKMFLGISVEVGNWSTDGNSCSLMIQENPFTEFVELPPQYADIHYCNILVGVIQGALEMVQLNVACKFVKDMLKGDEVTELRMELKGVIGHEMGDEYKEE